MEGENFFYTSYKGSKDFTQQGVRTTNATGFGAAADDYAERGIDLNEQLVKNKPATFFLRVNSDAMVGAGVNVGDVVIVDRSVQPKNGSLIIAVVDGELLIRKLETSNNRTRLVTANKKLSSLDVTGAQLQVWGVVTYIIHKA
jgi:DNA polymerase V